MDRWIYHMKRGEFEAAWTVSDEVLRLRAGVPCWHLPRHLQYVWDGTPLAGQRVLVRCYHGLGDTIQFIRYAPLLKAIATEVSVWAQPVLLPLLRTMRGIDRLLPLHDGAPEGSYDAEVEVMELPHVFRTTLATIPADIPYLQVEPASLPHDERLTVGLVWCAGEWDARRSIPFAQIEPLAGVPRVRWYILQRGPGLAERRDGFGVIPAARSLFEEGQLIRSLDLVISVDTMPAHLAGALGIPVWTLLPAEADWRWMEGRDDSPWYPNMRLFRQVRSNDWTPVVARVAGALERRAQARVGEMPYAG